ncbi:MAG: hypothetical protein GW763_14620 [Paraglaciecola sp.]|nr:hypothetical protein [Paraglaciecola sp.]NCT49185.1 hypothetical protein [Paraglaciecola sp.]
MDFTIFIPSSIDFLMRRSGSLAELLDFCSVDYQSTLRRQVKLCLATFWRYAQKNSLNP